MACLMTWLRSASTSAVLDPDALAGAAASLAACCSAARTRDTTAVANPSSQLRRHARGLPIYVGTSAAASPCHICTSSDVYSTSARSMSDAYPKTWIRLPDSLLGRTTHWQRIADASPHSRCAWRSEERRVGE